MLKQIFFGLLLAGICSLAYYINWMMLFLDFNKKIYNHKPGPCKTVNGIEFGSEDIELIPEDNIAFITSGLHHVSKRDLKVKPGIFMYDFKKKDAIAKPLEIISEKLDRINFSPHGLTSYRTADGKLMLYVINHVTMSRNYIEIFEYQPEKAALLHVKTIKDKKLIRPNDIVAVGHEQFIFTNDGYAQHFVFGILESMLRFKWGSLVYFDGQKSHYLHKSMDGANGITISKDGRMLFVALATAKEIGIYKLSEDFLQITLHSTVTLTSAPDNLFLAEDGALWIGAHPVLHEIVGMLDSPDDPKYTPPSQIVRITFTDDYHNFSISDPYSNDGREISGASIAVHHDGRLLIGSVFRTMLECEISDRNIL